MYKRRQVVVPAATVVGMTIYRHSTFQIYTLVALVVICLAISDSGERVVLHRRRRRRCVHGGTAMPVIVVLVVVVVVVSACVCITIAYMEYMFNIYVSNEFRRFARSKDNQELVGDMN